MATNNSLRLAFSNPRAPRRNQSKTSVMSTSISAKSDATSTIIAFPNRRKAGIRAQHAIAVAAAILLGLGAKLFFFTAPPTEADSSPPSVIKSASADFYQERQNIKNLPVQEFRDMSLVFSDWCIS
jgi:hypothetical protein